jgi:hypothetical protein
MVECQYPHMIIHFARVLAFQLMISPAGDIPVHSPSQPQTRNSETQEDQATILAQAIVHAMLLSTSLQRGGTAAPTPQTRLGYTLCIDCP